MCVFRYAYSQDGEPTIIPKNSGNIKDIKLGQASTLSHLDKMKINKLYKCGQCQTSRTNLRLLLFQSYCKMGENNTRHVTFFCVCPQVARMITNQQEGAESPHNKLLLNHGNNFNKDWFKLFISISSVCMQSCVFEQDMSLMLIRLRKWAGGHCCERAVLIHPIHTEYIISWHRWQLDECEEIAILLTCIHSLKNKSMGCGHIKREIKGILIGGRQDIPV